MNKPASELIALADIPRLIETLEAYGFACEAGPLTNCGEWRHLKRLATPPAQPAPASGESCANSILRAIWDDIETAAVETPVDNYECADIRPETLARLADHLAARNWKDKADVDLPPDDCRTAILPISVRGSESADLLQPVARGPSETPSTHGKPDGAAETSPGDVLAMKEACIRICLEEAAEWDSDKVQPYKNYPGQCANRIDRLDVIVPLPRQDNFNGDNERLIACINATLKLDADNALVPHGLSNNSRKLLQASAARLDVKAETSPGEALADLKKLEAIAERQKSYFATKQREFPCIEDFTDDAGKLTPPDDISPLLKGAEANGRYSESDWWLSTIRTAITATEDATFYGAQCPSYPACSGGCGLGCTHDVKVEAKPKDEAAVAYMVERKSDRTFPRFYSSRADADALVECVNVSPAATIQPLYTHPTTKPEAPAVSVDAETIDAVARIIDPTAWKMEHGYWMEQAHAYEAISKATAIAALIVGER